MKKILILGGTAQQIKLVEAAKKMGVYTIVTDYLVDSPAKKVADEAWMLNIKDVDQIVERCKQEQVNGVMVKLCFQIKFRKFLIWKRRIELTACHQH